jgi:EAL and modified HD-GYP domain-containing signal transduction protein
MIEVPAFMASRPGGTGAAGRGRAAGGTLALKGPAREALPACGGVGLRGECRRRRRGHRGGRAAAPARRHHAPGELDAAFAPAPSRRSAGPSATRRAVPAKTTVAPELQVILELINRVDREEPVDRLEAVLKNDPTLAFRLLRYINSPAFGLSVEISSFRHALMILGYQRLKRWLALLLASASKDPT